MTVIILLTGTLVIILLTSMGVIILLISMGARPLQLSVSHVPAIQNKKPLRVTCLRDVVYFCNTCKGSFSF